MVVTARARTPRARSTRRSRLLITLRASRTSAPSLYRSQIVEKDVIARSTGRKLGRVVQLWCDRDTLEVIALNVQKSGRALVDKVEPRDIVLSELRQLGDVALVEDEGCLELTENVWGQTIPSSLINIAVVSEDAEYIGKVRDFRFNPETGRIQSLIIDEVAWLPVVLPENFVSTYSVDVNEILQVGVDRIIVQTGAEKRVKQLSVGLFGQMNLASPAWDNTMERRMEGQYQDEDMYDYDNYEVVRRDTYAEPQRRFSRSLPQARQRDVGWQDEPVIERTLGRSRVPSDRRTRRSEGIPIVAPPPPYKRRDADGGLGERPPVQESQATPGKSFDEWVERTPVRDAMYADEAVGAEAGGTPMDAVPGYDPEEDRL